MNKEKINKEFIEFVDFLKEEKKITYTTIARRLNVDKQKVNNIRKGTSSANISLLTTLYEIFALELKEYGGYRKPDTSMVKKISIQNEINKLVEELEAKKEEDIAFHNKTISELKELISQIKDSRKSPK